MQTSDFKQLVVWQRSMALVKEVYTLLKLIPQEERFGLIDQIRRSVVSIPSNIAEGQSRSSAKDFNRFLAIARGSSAELETQILICIDLSYFHVSEAAKVLQLVQEINKMLRSLMKKIEERERGN